MPRARGRVTLPSAIVAALCGAVLGLLSFAASATLWRAGAHSAAELSAEAVTLAALVAVAAITLLAEPARLRRVRVTARPMPITWLPRSPELLPSLALCAGVPVAAGAAAAAYIFR